MRGSIFLDITDDGDENNVVGLRLSSFARQLVASACTRYLPSISRRLFISRAISYFLSRTLYISIRGGSLKPDNRAEISEAFLSQRYI
ncbi:hypothetical protein PUN28_008673 [Cardiocondyla obscurior]|uniref:Uncharacterized protein n=1 Tax=Cardiocondyla obscurior TaxID=286306 RepID=A0AAW2G1Q2_9HYME